MVRISLDAHLKAKQTPEVKWWLKITMKNTIPKLSRVQYSPLVQIVKVKIQLPQLVGVLRVIRLVKVVGVILFMKITMFSCRLSSGLEFH